jgi:acetyltransferase-like isoleucine patch superfamily enzyme
MRPSKLQKILVEFLYKLYKPSPRKVRCLLRWIISTLDGGEVYSTVLRKIYKHYFNVDIGMYTHGSCFSVKLFDKYTQIGRYCSIGNNAKVFNRNHPMDFKSSHGFFFNPVAGFTDKDLVKYTPLTIGNDVWIGDGVKIMPQVTNVGDGAVIGAGSVITKNIPPYAVVVGYPARIVRYRFSKEVIDELLKSKWWEKDIEEIKPHLQEYQQPYEKLYFDKKNADSRNK